MFERGIEVTQKEVEKLYSYFYACEDRLEAAYKDCNYRYVRRDLDSVDLLEEIIALERLNAFKDFKADVLKLLNLMGDI